MISILQYALVLGAVANVLFCSYTLGTYMVLSWRCQNFYMLMLWTLLPLVVHTIATVGFRLSPAGSQFSRIGYAQSSKKPKSIWRRLVYWLKQEAMPCAAQKMPEVPKEADGFAVVSLQWLASGVGYVHILFGTLVLSSLLFIGVI